jgi:hypothetical protein
MFTKESLGDGRALLGESLGRPIVYLDNWAINDIALDDAYRNRFVSTLNDREGTLRLSISNVVELMKQTDRKQIETILQIRRIRDRSIMQKFNSSPPPTHIPPFPLLPDLLLQIKKERPS